MKVKLETWQYPVLCSGCHTMIWSEYSGQYVECDCGSIFCDQTPHYSRYGGSKVLIPRSVSYNDEESSDA